MLKLTEGYTTLDRPGVTPTDTLTEAGRKALAFYLGKLMRDFPGVRKAKNADVVHNMRVSTRRMRSALRLFAPFYKRSAIKPLRRGLSDLAEALGAVRDLDVLIEKTEKYAEKLAGSESATSPAPGAKSTKGRGKSKNGSSGQSTSKARHLAGLRAALKARRKIAHANLLELLDSEQFSEFIDAMVGFVDSEDKSVPDTTAPRVRDTVPRLIYAQYGVLRAYEDAAHGLANAPLDTLHSLRIEAKRLRYTLETFTEVLGPEAQQVIEAVKLLQDHLGDLQDARVAVDALDSYLDADDDEGKRAIQAYMTVRNAEKQTLQTQVTEVWAAFTREELRRALALSVSAL
jgi:CHAD domain-containing protein